MTMNSVSIVVYASASSRTGLIGVFFGQQLRSKALPFGVTATPRDEQTTGEHLRGSAVPVRRRGATHRRRHSPDGSAVKLLRTQFLGKLMNSAGFLRSRCVVKAAAVSRASKSDKSC